MREEDFRVSTKLKSKAGLLVLFENQKIDNSIGEFSQRAGKRCNILEADQCGF